MLHYNIPLQPSIPLFTALKHSDMCSCGCSIVKSKAIGSTRSRFTPTEPNWTDEPAVINDGDKQHLSGMEPKKRGIPLYKIKSKEVLQKEIIYGSIK